MRTPALVLAVTFAIGSLAACGGSDGSDGASGATTSSTPSTTTTEARPPVSVTEEEYVAAMTENLSAGDEAEGQLVLSEDQAACMAPKWVAAMTVELLQENGVTADELADPAFAVRRLGMGVEQGRAMVDAFGACTVDVVALFTASLTGGLTPAQQQCAAEKADPELVAQLLAKTFSTGDSTTELGAVTQQLTEACDLPSR